jgi:hypothetical protein
MEDKKKVNPRQARLKELTGKANRSPIEETERAALEKEFPGFDAGRDPRKEAEEKAEAEAKKAEESV